MTAWHFTGGGGRPPRDVLATLRRRLEGTLHGTVREDRPAMVQAAGARALTVDFGADGTGARQLVLATGTMVYEVSAMLPASPTPAMVADAERFLASFRLND